MSFCSDFFIIKEFHILLFSSSVDSTIQIFDASLLSLEHFLSSKAADGRHLPCGGLWHSQTPDLVPVLGADPLAMSEFVRSACTKSRSVAWTRQCWRPTPPQHVVLRLCFREDSVIPWTKHSHTAHSLNLSACVIHWFRNIDLVTCKRNPACAHQNRPVNHSVVREEE